MYLIMYPDDDFRSELEVVFPGDTYQRFMDGMMESAVEEISQLWHLRRDLAISGAMRWEFSSEAPIRRQRGPFYI